MNSELLGGLALFAFASSITPGPNNLMLLASGANFGLRRTLPHLAGVALGFVFLLLMVGTGLLQLFQALPGSQWLLKVAAVGYLSYLALRIATAAPATPEVAASGRPFSFWQAVAFQWVNPKAWTMALTAVAVYAPSQSLWAVAGVAGVFGLINLPCVSAWTLLGQRLRGLLADPRRMRLFNRVLALLLLGSLIPVLRS